MDPKVKPSTHTIGQDEDVQKNKGDGAKTLVLRRVINKATNPPVDALYWFYVPFVNDEPRADSNLRAYISPNPARITSPAQFEANIVDTFTYTNEKGEKKTAKYKMLVDINGDSVPYVPGQSFVFLDKKVRINLPAKRNSNGTADFGGMFPHDIHIAAYGSNELTVSGLDVASLDGKDYYNPNKKAPLANRITLEDGNEGKVKLLVGNIDTKPSAHHLFGVGTIDTLSTDDARVSRIANIGGKQTLVLSGNCHIDACRFKLPSSIKPKVVRPVPGQPVPKNQEKQGEDRVFAGYSLNVGGVANNNLGPTVPLVTFSNRTPDFVIMPIGGNDASVAQVKLKGFPTSLDEVRQTFADAQAKVVIDFGKNRKVDARNPAVGAILLDTGKAPMHSELAKLLDEEADASQDVKTLAPQSLKFDFLKDKKIFVPATADLPADMLKAMTKANPKLKTAVLNTACAEAFHECKDAPDKLEAKLAEIFCRKDVGKVNLCGFASDDAAKQAAADIAKNLSPQKPVPGEAPKKDMPMRKLPPFDIDRLGALPVETLERALSAADEWKNVEFDAGNGSSLPHKSAQPGTMKKKAATV